MKWVSKVFAGLLLVVSVLSLESMVGDLRGDGVVNPASAVTWIAVPFFLGVWVWQNQFISLKLHLFAFAVLILVLAPGLSTAASDDELKLVFDGEFEITPQHISYYDWDSHIIYLNKEGIEHLNNKYPNVNGFAGQPASFDFVLGDAIIYSGTFVYLHMSILPQGPFISFYGWNSEHPGLRIGYNQEKDPRSSAKIRKFLEQERLFQPREKWHGSVDPKRVIALLKTNNGWGEHKVFALSCDGKFRISGVYRDTTVVRGSVSPDSALVYVNELLGMDFLDIQGNFSSTRMGLSANDDGSLDVQFEEVLDAGSSIIVLFLGDRKHEVTLNYPAYAAPKELLGWTRRFKSFINSRVEK